jgi:hypothetical protein
MVEEDEIVVLKSLGGVDEDSHKLSENQTTKLLIVESIHLQCDNDLIDNDDLHLVVIVAQAHKWEPNNKNSICWGFFCS